MQDRYAGDIGDFGKYSLLNFIQRETGLKQGVNWYRTCPVALREQHRNDGKFIQYDNLMYLDENLYNQLQKIVGGDSRSVKMVEKGGIFPKGTVFFSEEVDVKNRKEWFERVIVQFKDSEIVFMDPDNGVGNDPYSAKHVLFSEIQAHIKNNQSVIVYHHCDRSPKKNPCQIEAWRNRFKPLQDMIPGLSVPAIRFRRKSARDYIFISQPKHHQLVLIAINALLQTEWGQKEKGFNSPHFERTPDWFHW